MIYHIPYTIYTILYLQLRRDGATTEDHPGPGLILQYMYIYIYMYICVFMYICLYIYVYMYIVVSILCYTYIILICMYIYIYIHTHTIHLLCILQRAEDQPGPGLPTTYCNYRIILSHTTHYNYIHHTSILYIYIYIYVYMYILHATNYN